MSSRTETKNMPALEQILSDVRDRAMTANPVIAEVISEALTICQSQHTVHAGISFQLQCALASIRTGRAEDAVGHIENALSIEANWAGMGGHQRETIL